MKNKTVLVWLAIGLLWAISTPSAVADTFYPISCIGVLPTCNADTGEGTIRYNRDTPVSEKTLTVLLLPNNTLIANLSINLSKQIASGTAVIQGNVTLYYNDSTTYSESYSTTSTSVVVYTLFNPRPGVSVDRIVYTGSQYPPGSTGFHYLGLMGFWAYNLTPKLTISVLDPVTNTLVGGFCATITDGEQEDAYCSITNTTSPVDGSLTGWGGSTRNTNYETYINALHRSGNVTKRANITGTIYATPPWYSSSSQCDASVLKSGFGITAGQQNITHYYLVVSDEFSDDCLVHSMSQNSTRETDMLACYNTIKALNASAGGYGVLVEWISTYDNRTGTPFFNKSATNDAASDADARLLQSMFNTANNQYFPTTSVKTNARVLAQQMCVDMVKYEMVATNKISHYNTSRNTTYFPAGGPNVAAAGITGTDFMYSGYYGDILLALLQCGEDTGNTTYYTVAFDVAENLFSAANWTSSTGFKVPPGRAFKWTNTAEPVATCTTICTPAYIDDPDGKRMTKVCAAEYIGRTNGHEIHPALQEYCLEWYQAFNSATHYRTEWYANGTPKNSLSNESDVNGLATFIDMSANFTNAIARQKIIGDGRYSSATQTFNSAACMGLYGPSLVMEPLGLLISQAAAESFGLGGDNACSGEGDPVTYTQNGLRLTMNRPVNQSNITSNSVNLTVVVYNLNVTSNSSSTPGPLPQILYNSSFSTTPANDGWTLNSWTWTSAGGGVINNTADNGGAAWTNNLSLTQMTNGYNVTLNMSVSNFTNAKIFFGTTNGAQSGDRILLERSGNSINVKHDGGAFSSFTIAMKQYVIVSIFVNLTNNTVSVRSGASSWTDALANSHLTVNGSYLAFVPGQNMSTNNQNSTGWNISDINVTNVGTAYNITSSETQSEGMNVTLYDASGPSSLLAVTNASNASTVSYNWTGISGAEAWFVHVRSVNNNETFGPFIFTAFTGSTSETVCTVGTTIDYESEGNLSVFVYNITAGTAAQRYFNQTKYYNFSTSDNIYYKSLNVTSSQAFIDLMTLQLFTNATILGFNTTNNRSYNQTSNGTILLYAVNGTNNIQIDVAGNYSKNVSCAVTSPLSTLKCNATGIYDTKLTVGTFTLLGNLSSFAARIYNQTLGGFLYNLTTTNGSLVFNLLQGYAYNVSVNSTGFLNRSESITPDEPAETLNLSLEEVIIYFTFRDEITRQVLNGTNVTLSLIDSQGIQSTYTSVSGSFNVTNIFLPGTYTLRYNAANYSTRDYYFEIDPSITNLTLYLLSHVSYTPGVVEIRSYDGLLVSDATVIMRRFYGAENIPTIVQMGTTDSFGQVVFVAEAITGNYLFEVQIDEVTRYNGTVPEILAIGADGLWHKTIILGAPNSSVSMDTGITYEFSPESPVLVGGSYDFSFSIDSDYWNVSACTLSLVNESGYTFSSSSASCDGSDPSISYSPPERGRFVATAQVSLGSFNQTYTFLYTAIEESDSDFTIKDLLDDIADFDGAGFGQSTKFLLGILIILGVMVGLSSKTDLISTPEESMILVALLSILFSYIGWFYLDIPIIPLEAVKQYLISVLLCLLAALSYFRKQGVTE